MKQGTELIAEERQRQIDVEPREGMTHGAKVVMFVIGTCMELKAKGLLQGGTDLTPDGVNAFLALKASGFEPTEAEIDATMFRLQNLAAKGDQR